MTVIVPIGFLVGVDDIAGHTHYLYYHEEQLIAFVIAFLYYMYKIILFQLC